MQFNQFKWTTGLDESGWIAVALFTIFFIITLITLGMMLKLLSKNKNTRHTKHPKSPQQPVSRPAKSENSPLSHKTEVKNAEKEDDYSNPVEEAKVFLAYGLNKQAIDLLETYLKENPSDKNARETLAKAQLGARQ